MKIIIVLVCAVCVILTVAACVAVKIAGLYELD